MYICIGTGSRVCKCVCVCVCVWGPISQLCSATSTQSHPLVKYKAKFSYLWCAKCLTVCFSTLHQWTLISHTKLAPGWALIQVNFDPIISQSRGWALFCETTVYVVPINGSYSMYIFLSPATPTSTGTRLYLTLWATVLAAVVALALANL